LLYGSEEEQMTYEIEHTRWHPTPVSASRRQLEPIMAVNRKPWSMTSGP